MDCLFQQQSTYATAREIIRQHGFSSQGLGKGMTSTLGRHGVFNMIYFGFYHNVRGVVPEFKVMRKNGKRKQMQ